METNVIRTRVKTIEDCLIYSVRLLAGMDHAAGVGGVLFIPDVFVWTLEQINPSVIQQLRGLGLLDKFNQRLAQYQELRVLAEPLRLENHMRAEAYMCTELQDVGYLTLSDIQNALDYGDWRPDDTSARLCFARVLRAACAMPYPEGEMVTNLGDPLLFYTGGPQSASEQFLPLLEDTSTSLNARMPRTLETALAHIRRELIASDGGREDRHWAYVYTAILGAWLQEDMPREAAQVLAGGHVKVFFDELAQFRHQMEQVERIWNAMGKTVRALALRSNEQTASLVIAEFVRADDTADAEVPAWTSLLRNMVKRRGHGESSGVRKNIFDLTETLETSAVVEKIRNDSRAKTAGYLISRADLPKSLRGGVREQVCLAVRVPEERVHISETLAQATALQCFYSQTDGLADVSQTQLSISRAFWCEYHALWPTLFRFRRVIPVLFIFDQRCILVQYPFTHFSDLRSIVDDRTYRWTVNISDGPWTDWSAQERIGKLPDGTQLKPTMLDQIVDLSGTVHANPLGDAYTNSRSEKS